MEQSSPSRTAGLCVRTVTLAGESYVLSQPQKVRKAADEEMVVCSRRQIPPGISDTDRPSAIAAVVAGIASPEEWRSYLNSAWQLAFCFWTALDPAERKRCAGVAGKTPAETVKGVYWAYETVMNADVTQDEVQLAWAAIRCVGQEDALGESSGSTGAAATPLTANPSTEAGLPSTPSS